MIVKNKYFIRKTTCMLTKSMPSNLLSYEISYDINYIKLWLKSLNQLPSSYIDSLYCLNNIRPQIIPIKEDIKERINNYLEHVRFDNGKDYISIINPYTQEWQNIPKKKPRLYKAWKRNDSMNFEGIMDIFGFVFNGSILSNIVTIRYNMSIHPGKKQYMGIFGEEYEQIDMVTQKDYKIEPVFEFVGFVYSIYEYKKLFKRKKL